MAVNGRFHKATSFNDVNVGMDAIKAKLDRTALEYAAPVQDLVELTAITYEDRVDKQCRLVEDVEMPFRFDADSIVAPNGVSILNPDDVVPPAAGRWIMIALPGDMTKGVYDTDDDGIVNAANELDDGAGAGVTAVEAEAAYDHSVIIGNPHDTNVVHSIRNAADARLLEGLVDGDRLAIDDTNTQYMFIAALVSFDNGASHIAVPNDGVPGFLVAYAGQYYDANCAFVFASFTGGAESADACPTALLAQGDMIRVITASANVLMVVTDRAVPRAEFGYLSIYTILEIDDEVADKRLELLSGVQTLNGWLFEPVCLVQDALILPDNSPSWRQLPLELSAGSVPVIVRYDGLTSYDEVNEFAGRRIYKPILKGVDGTPEFAYSKEYAEVATVEAAGSLFIASFVRASGAIGAVIDYVATNQADPDVRRTGVLRAVWGDTLGVGAITDLAGSQAEVGSTGALTFALDTAAAPTLNAVIGDGTVWDIQIHVRLLGEIAY